MKKVLKVGAFLLAAVLLAGFLYVVNFLTGYPVSMFIVQHSLNTYMAEAYPDRDFVAEKPERNLKEGGFTSWVSSPSDPQVKFVLYFSVDGTLEQDAYEAMVGSGYHNALALSRRYDAMCTKVLENGDFPYEAVCSGSLESAIHGDKQQRGEPGVLPEKMEIKDLDPEMDVSLLSSRYGTVYLDVKSDLVTSETVEESLLELKKLMAAANLPFCSCEVWVQSDDQKNLHILNFGWNDIYEEGMTERVNQAIQATEKYFE